MSSQAFSRIDCFEPLKMRGSVWYWLRCSDEAVRKVWALGEVGDGLSFSFAFEARLSSDGFFEVYVVWVAFIGIALLDIIEYITFYYL